MKWQNAPHICHTSVPLRNLVICTIALFCNLKDSYFQADHDTYIIMENLKNLLSHYNSTQPLFAGAIYLCR